MIGLPTKPPLSRIVLGLVIDLRCDLKEAAGILSVLLPILMLLACCSPSLAIEWPIEHQEPRQLAGMFGDWRVDSWHNGVDIPGDFTSRIVAAKAGVVMSARYNVIMGSWDMLIKSLEGTSETLVYSHLLDLRVVPNCIVAAGDIIDRGVTHELYDHLHFAVHATIPEVWPQENPLNPGYLGPLYKDTSNPVIVSLYGAGKHFDLLANDGLNGGGYPDMERDPPLVAGKIDIISKAVDNNPSPSGFLGGICRIGYTLKNMATGEYWYPTNDPWWLVKFEVGNHYWPQSAYPDRVGAVYDPRTDQHDPYYIVTNDIFGWKGNPMPYLGVDKDGCWNTRQKVEEELSEDALWNSQAKFPDGRYEIYVRAEDRYENPAVLHPISADDDSERGVAGASMEVQVETSRCMSRS